VPLWHGSASAFGATYAFTIVGRDPFVRQGEASVTIPVDLIPVRLEFLDSSNQVVKTFDPTAVNGDCGLTTSPTQLVEGSPLFQPADYRMNGVDIGTVQYLDAYMRANFATQALAPNAPNPGYGVAFALNVRPAVTVSVPAGSWTVLGAAQTGACGGRPGGDLGMVSFTGWDAYLHQSLISQLQSSGETKPTDMLDFMFANVALCTPGATNTTPDLQACAQGQNLAGGYHSSDSAGSGVQYYDTASYDSTGLFPSALDIGAMSHELAEWMNDPDGDNPTPPWGHIGQVPGCQNNLEVGDPLSQNSITVTMPNGITYHPQELAFLSWFYRQRPSSGVNGWYSSNGTFTAPQPVCSGAPTNDRIPLPSGHIRGFGS